MPRDLFRDLAPLPEREPDLRIELELDYSGHSPERLTVRGSDGSVGWLDLPRDGDVEFQVFAPGRARVRIPRGLAIEKGLIEEEKNNASTDQV